MSSHHLATESQSTALLIYGVHIDPEVLSQLLEWNPLIIVPSSEVEIIVSLDVRIDILIKDDGAKRWSG